MKSKRFSRRDIRKARIQKKAYKEGSLESPEGETVEEIIQRLEQEAREKGEGTTTNLLSNT